MKGIKEKVNLKKFERVEQYNRFIKEKTPSVCVTGCFDVTNLYKIKKRGHSFNCLMCYCIQQAGQNVKEFHYAIKEDGLYYYKNVKTNAVIDGIDGQLYYGDYKYNEKFDDFEKEYQRVNEYCSKNCMHLQEDTGALLSTSAVIGYPFTSITLGLSDTFWDNFLMWGKYEKKLFKVKLNVTLRFHHATIDGQRAAIFFNELQKQINNLKI